MTCVLLVDTDTLMSLANLFFFLLKIKTSTNKYKLIWIV